MTEKPLISQKLSAARERKKRVSILRGIGEETKMIYRRWSLLITPPLVVGSIVAGTLAYNFFLGGNERFFKKIREQEKASLEQAK